MQFTMKTSATGFQDYPVDELIHDSQSIMFCFRPTPDAKHIVIFPVSGKDGYYLEDDDCEGIRFRKLLPGEEVVITIKN